MGILDKIKTAAEKVKSDIDTGNKETEGLGNELRAKSDMIRAARGDSDTPAAPAPKSAPKTDSGHRYGDRPGEKRIDVTEAMKPLGSFKKGTPYVPKTGVYKLHEGEKVVPKEKNTMNAADAMAGITGKSKPPKKIKTIEHKKTDDGKTVHTHRHHYPEHHPEETHVSNDDKEMAAHMAEHMPNMTAQPPAMPAPDAGAEGGVGAPPAAAAGM